jgi:threonyl-tRNA synthetase
MSLMDDFEFRYETAFRVVQEFFDTHREWILSLVKRLDKPVLLEILDERYFYWILKFEFNFVEFIGKAAALSTVQIDVESAERYKISYIDRQGESQYPTILHTSPSGALERVIYATLESAAILMDQGETPEFPLWLAPTQVRIIPVSERNLEYCEKTLSELNSSGIRADLDDRQGTVSKKIRDGETEWIPYILVIGDEEEKSNTVSVRARGKKGVQSMTQREFLDSLTPYLEDKVLEQSYTSNHLSKRPIFFSSE